MKRKSPTMEFEAVADEAEDVVFEPVGSSTSVSATPMVLLVPTVELASIAKDPLPPAKPMSWLGRIRWLIGWTLYGVGSGLEWLFGAAALMVGLAVLAALPIVQFLSLGYLLESGARVARTGRFSEGFIGVRLAARLGGIVIFSWLLMLPARYVAGVAESAYIIDPGSDSARAWRFGLLVTLALTGLHIAAACARGGKLRHFLWPFNIFWLLRRMFKGGYYREMRDNAWDTLQALRLPYYFSLGFRGFVVAVAWLFVPVSLLALGHLNPLFGIVGTLALAYVLSYLPFLQMRMAVEDRLSAGFSRRDAKAEYGKAPWIMGIAFVLTLATALPLYLAKIEVVPAEAAWLPSLFFIVFIFPARLLTGWALYWARRRDKPSHWFFRWTGRLPFLPAALFYVMILFFSQYTSWNGVWSLYEQHAFLVPAPFFGM